ncbi:hypothetical protein SAY87_029335 [Trapa incisa]|uniref:HMA domain-containing protein n=1 Tax=Trapa incisa TaxID=236973 RepID=A0AAN7KC99_9MYRT|nr:hypothetical protein SAY87_029335 [Trapa incisa]
MSSQHGNMKNQICVLRVNIHCEGCKKKVKKLLQKIEGVDGTVVDAEQGKVTVSGYVHPNVLIKKLSKSGKHAELWAAAKNSLYAVENRRLQFDKLNKPQKGSNNGYTKDLSMTNVGPKPKAPKPVKFDLTDDGFYGSDGEFRDDGKNGFELGLGRRPPLRTPTRGGGDGRHGLKEKKKVAHGTGKDGDDKGKKKRGFFMFRSLFFRGFGRKNKSKNSSGGGGAKEGGVKQGAIEFKKGGKNGGWMVENSKNGGKAMGDNSKGEDNRINGYGGGGKASDYQGMDLGNLRKGSTAATAGGDGSHRGYRNGGLVSQVDHMGNHAMGSMGNYHTTACPMGPEGPIYNNAFAPMGLYAAVSQPGGMGNYQPVHGLPGSVNGVYFHGNGPINRQYTAVMMSQPPYVQQPNGMFHPMMHGRPPHHASDGYTNMFNDENTESCSIM